MQDTLLIHVRIILPFFIAIWLSPVSGQPPDYRAIFGDDWTKAEDFVSANTPWIRQELNRYNIDFNEAIAVIFPELVRYSALRDKMEITLLKALFINIGSDYADFSIGQFQMKPSFADRIRRDALRLPWRFRRLVPDSTDFDSNRSYRSSIVDDLEDVRRQVNYLILFIKVCYIRFDAGEMKTDERIRFLASAYNTGYWKSRDEIIKMSEKKYFSTRLNASEYYCYPEISLFWYSGRSK